MHLGSLDDAISQRIRDAIVQAIPDAAANVSGRGGHFSIEVVSKAFEGKNSVQSQRLVYSAIRHLMAGDNAPVHAIDKLVTKVS